jgi:hypothetical protein
VLRYCLHFKKQKSSLIILVDTRKRKFVREFILSLKTLGKKVTVFRRIKGSLILKLPEPITKEWRRGLTKFLLIQIFYFLIYIQHHVVFYGYAGKEFIQLQKIELTPLSALRLKA